MTSGSCLTRTGHGAWDEPCDHSQERSRSDALRTWLSAMPIRPFVLRGDTAVWFASCASRFP